MLAPEQLLLPAGASRLWRGNSTGVMLRTQHLLGPGVAAKGASPGTSGRELDGQALSLGSEPFAEHCKSLFLQLCRRKLHIEKNICVLKREERACSLGSERVFHLAVTCRKKKGNNFTKYSLKCFRLECVSRTPGSTSEAANAAQSLLHSCSACPPATCYAPHPFPSILAGISALFTVSVP